MTSGALGEAERGPAGAPEERFENGSIYAGDRIRHRTVVRIGVAAGVLILVVGVLLLTALRSGPLDATSIGPGIFAGLGAVVLIASAVSLRFGQELAEVTVDDSRLQFRYVGGTVTELRWDDPSLELSLSRVVEMPPRDPKVGRAWVLTRRPSGWWASPLVTLEIGSALVRRGRKAGLETTATHREFTRRGSLAAFEGWILARPGHAKAPGPEWNPRVVTSGETMQSEPSRLEGSARSAAAGAPPVAPPRPKLPHC